MADPSLPPDINRRLSALEEQVRNLQRSQNPDAPNLVDLNDVSGVGTSDGQVLVYDRAQGRWKPTDAVNVNGSPGDVKWSATPAFPPGPWLAADGGSYLRSSYPALFAAIGTTYGAVDGSHFSVPNTTDLFVVGAGGAKALAATGGSANAIVVAHTHGTNVKATSTEATGYGPVASGSFTDRLRIDGSGDTSASTGSSGTGANLPPYIALYAYIRY